MRADEPGFVGAPRALDGMPRIVNPAVIVLGADGKKKSCTFLCSSSYTQKRCGESPSKTLPTKNKTLRGMTL